MKERDSKKYKMDNYFTLYSFKDINLFENLLVRFLKNKTLTIHKDLAIKRVFKYYKNKENGKKFFNLLLDLIINYSLSIWDYHDLCALINDELIPKEKKLSFYNYNNFKRRLDFHRQITNCIFRTRALADKVMTCYIVRLFPENFDKIDKAKSKRKAFINILRERGKKNVKILKPIEDFNNYLIEFDNNFRTPEIHGSGKIRKWTFYFGDDENMIMDELTKLASLHLSISELTKFLLFGPYEDKKNSPTELYEITKKKKIKVFTFDEGSDILKEKYYINRKELLRRFKI